jgi:putative NADH-flavin reductase
MSSTLTLKALTNRVQDDKTLSEVTNLRPGNYFPNRRLLFMIRLRRWFGRTAVKIIIFGATGRTGKALVEQALAAGHTVTAYVRDASKLSTQHPQLSVVVGTLNEFDKIVSAVAGQEAVLSALGPVRGGSKTVMEDSAKAITAAMKQTGVRRLITVTGAGVSQPGDRPKAFNKLMSFMLNTFAKDVLIDSTNHVDIVRSSNLDWTIVRVPMLTGGERKGQYRVGMVGDNDGPRISRADVADFMLKQLTDTSYIGKSPVISY